LAYPVSVGVVVVYETYSDYTCMVLYRDSGPAEQWTYARGPYREYLPDPGYSCNYLVNGEWIEIREELPVAKGFASAASITVAAIAFAGLLVHYRRQPTADLYP
jgi:hypothetical protein